MDKLQELKDALRELEEAQAGRLISEIPLTDNFWVVQNKVRILQAQNK